MATLNVSERNAKRLQDLAAARGLSVDEAIEEYLQEKEPRQPTTDDEVRQQKAARYGLDMDDPLLDLIGLLGDIDEDAVTLSRDAMDEFYRSHLDEPR